MWKLFHRDKHITILNPNDQVIAKFMLNGIDTFTIDKIGKDNALTVKNSRKNRKILKSLDQDD